MNKVWDHCLICNKMYLNGSDYTTHTTDRPDHNITLSRTRLSESSSGKKTVQTFCNVCNIYVSKKKYKRHLLKQTHLSALANTSIQHIGTNQDEIETVYCDVCKKDFYPKDFPGHVQGKKHLMQLKKGHSEHNNVILTQNESTPETKTSSSSKELFLVYLKNMIAKYNLKVEMPMVDNDGVIVTTPKGYREKITFEVFHSYKHTPSYVVCQLCRKNIWTRDTTAHSMSKTHVRLMLQPVDDNFSRKHFLNRTRYVEHMRYNHAGAKKEKNKLCNVCGRGFATNRTLVNHIRTHSGERLFKCIHCAARFTQKHSILSHVKYLHLKNKRRAPWQTSALQ